MAAVVVRGPWATLSATGARAKTGIRRTRNASPGTAGDDPRGDSANRMAHSRFPITDGSALSIPSPKRSESQRPFAPAARPGTPVPPAPGPDSSPGLASARHRRCNDGPGLLLSPQRPRAGKVPDEQGEASCYRLERGSYRNVVKLTFFKGARLKDPAGLFNSSLEGNARRAIDIQEGESLDERAFKALVRDAVALNTSPGRG